MLNKLFKSAAIAGRIIALMTSLFFWTACDSRGDSHRPEVPAGARRQESFAIVRTHSIGNISSCHIEELQIDCRDALSIEDMLPLSRSSHGSGVVILHRQGRTYVLTAQHVCNDDNLVRLEEKEGHGGLKVSARIRWSSSNTVTDISGGRRRASIVFLDFANDLCVIESDGLWGVPVPVGRQDPVMGEMVYSVSAPYGLYDTDMAPTFFGIYSGSRKSLSATNEAPFLVMVDNHIYTFMSHPGSSGAGIFNRDGDLIGIVIAVIPDIYGVTVAASRQATYDIAVRVSQDLDRAR